MVKILVASERATTLTAAAYDGFLSCAISFIGHAFCPLSPVFSIKNCCCETNTYSPRIAFSRVHLPARLHLSDTERSTLAEIAQRLGLKALQEIARVAKPDNLFACIGNWWHSNSTVLAVAAILADPGYHRKWRRW
jgi:hypothetical protein